MSLQLRPFVVNLITVKLKYSSFCWVLLEARQRPLEGPGLQCENSICHQIGGHVSVIKKETTRKWL